MLNFHDESLNDLLENEKNVEEKKLKKFLFQKIKKKKILLLEILFLF